MALVKYGGGIVQMSGSLAGQTHARNRFGNYIRSRTKPVNPQTDRQNNARDIVAFLAEYWHSTLEDAERTAWATYAAAVAMKNRLGETVYLTGFNHFIRSNSVRLLMGLAVVEPGPTVLALPETDTTFAASGSEATDLISFTFDTGLPWYTDAGAQMALFQGQPQLFTRNFFKGPWRFVGALDGVSPSPTTRAAAFTLTEDQRIWCYGRICRSDGRLSEPFRDDFICDP